MADTAAGDPLAIALFSEVMGLDQRIRHHLSKRLPKGMELSHFSVLNHLVHVGGERSPAQLANTLGVTKGAMTNTLNKLQTAGFVHIRQDWDDARRKMVSISGTGRQARDQAVHSVAPLFDALVSDIGDQNLRDVLRMLRDLRKSL